MSATTIATNPSLHFVTNPPLIVVHYSLFEQRATSLTSNEQRATSNDCNEPSNEPTGKNVGGIMIAAQHGSRRHGQCAEKHEGDDWRRRSDDQQGGGHGFRRMTARKGIDLNARLTEQQEVQRTKRRRPGLTRFERARRARLDPRQHAETDVIGDEDDGPESRG